eukprot:jgi/Hompol1/1116/HPOL_001248-RA
MPLDKLDHDAVCKNEKQALVSIDDEEDELAQLVFGGFSKDGVSKALNATGKPKSRSTSGGEQRHKDGDEEAGDEEAEGQDTIPAADGFFGFSIDTVGEVDDNDVNDDDASKNKKSKKRGYDDGQDDQDGEDRINDPKEDEEQQKAAWVDDDDGVAVDLQDKARLRKLRKDFAESRITDVHRTQLLSPDRLILQRLKDANQLSVSQSVVQGIQFHPFAPVLLTCGFDKMLRLFQIDGKINPKIQSIHFKDFPIYRAHFTPDGKQVIVTSRRKWYFVHDLVTGQTTKIFGARARGNLEKSYERSSVSPCGRFIAFEGHAGNLILVSGQTRQWIGDLKMNGGINAMAFSSTGDDVFTYGRQGEVYKWDTETRECLYRFPDEGCIGASTLAVSPDDKYIATGSGMGVVNIYLASDIESWYTSTGSIQGASSSHGPKPIKTFDNLTTKITTLVFHPGSQLLVMASREVKDALRIIHLPTMRVVKNWPKNGTPLGYVSSVAFSPRGGYLSIGNAKGRALLYRIPAFDE